MTKVKLVIMVILASLLVLVSIGACAKTAPAPTTAPAPAPKPSPSPSPTATPTTKPSPSPSPTPTAKPTTAPATVKPIVLKGQTFLAESNPISVWMTWYFKELEKRTNGKVKVDLLYGDALGKQATAIDMLTGGVVDFAHIYAGYTPGRMPLFDFLSGFPFQWNSSAEASYAAYKLVQQGYFDKDLSIGKFKVLYVIMTGAYTLWTNKSVHVPADVKGLKVRSGGALMSRYLSAVGALPQTIPTADAYLAMQKGIIDGALHPTGSAYTSKFYEITPYFLPLNLVSGFMPPSVTMDTWNKFPPDVQKIITELGEEAALHSAYDVAEKEAYASFDKVGVKMYKPTDAEMALWLAPNEQLLREESKLLADKGYSATGFLADLEKYKKEYISKYGK